MVPFTVNSMVILLLFFGVPVRSNGMEWKAREQLHWLAIIWFITLPLEWKLDIKRLLPGDFLGRQNLWLPYPFSDVFVFWGNQATSGRNVNYGERTPKGHLALWCAWLLGLRFMSKMQGLTVVLLGALAALLHWMGGTWSGLLLPLFYFLCFWKKKKIIDHHVWSSSTIERKSTRRVKKQVCLFYLFFSQ